MHCVQARRGVPCIVDVGGRIVVLVLGGLVFWVANGRML